MKKFILLLFRLTIFFEMCWGAHAWFTWWCDRDKLITYLILIVVAAIAAMYQRINKIKLTKSRFVISGFLLFIIATIFRNHFALLGIARSILAVYPIWVMISDYRETVQGHLNFATKLIAWMSLLGIVEYVVVSAFGLPSIVINYGDYVNYIFFNYVFYIKNIGEYSMMTGMDFQRFSGVFLEPGYMSSLFVFLLYAQKFNIKKFDNIVILGTILVSLSLAGYVLTFIAYFFHRMLKRRIMGGIIGIAFVGVLFYVVGINYNQGNNYLNNEIISRLEYDKEKGISGNNRTTDITRSYFDQGLANGDSWIGLGHERVQKINGGGSTTGFDHNAINGTGAIYYFVVYGIISALLFLFSYYQLSRYCINKRYSLYFVLLIAICFIQAAYPDSSSWIYPFLLGIKSYSYEYKVQPKNKKRLVAIFT